MTMSGANHLPESFREVEIFLFDCDGVITSEEGYFDAAGLTIREILESPLYLGLSPQDYSVVPEVFYRRLASMQRIERRKYLSREFIVRLKARGLNSNWDLAFVVIGIYLGDLFGETLQALMESGEGKANEEQVPPDVWEFWLKAGKEGRWNEAFRIDQLAAWGNLLREKSVTVTPRHELHLQLVDDFHPDVRGYDILNELNHRLPTNRQHPDQAPVEPFCKPSPFWTECQMLFQEWYLGETLFEEIYGRPAGFGPKPGLIHAEEPLLGIPKTKRALEAIRDAGYTLGIATGRPAPEIVTPLEEWGLKDFFDAERFGTHDRVEAAEEEIAAMGRQDVLSKPDPFIFLRAFHPKASTLELIEDKSLRENNHNAAIVGDTVADIWAGKAAGFRTVAVLSGASGVLGRKQIEEAQPDLIVQDIYELAELIAKP